MKYLKEHTPVQNCDTDIYDIIRVVERGDREQNSRGSAVGKRPSSRQKGPAALNECLSRINREQKRSSAFKRGKNGKEVVRELSEKWTNEQ
jgi:hypothetical protein